MSDWTKSEWRLKEERTELRDEWPYRSFQREMAAEDRIREINVELDRRELERQEQERLERRQEEERLEAERLRRAEQEEYERQQESEQQNEEQPPC